MKAEDKKVMLDAYTTLVEKYEGTPDAIKNVALFVLLARTVRENETWSELSEKAQEYITQQLALVVDFVGEYIKDEYPDRKLPENYDFFLECMGFSDYSFKKVELPEDMIEPYSSIMSVLFGNVFRFYWEGMTDQDVYAYLCSDDCDPDYLDASDCHSAYRWAARVGIPMTAFALQQDIMNIGKEVSEASGDDANEAYAGLKDVARSCAKVLNIPEEVKEKCLDFLTDLIVIGVSFKLFLPAGGDEGLAEKNKKAIDKTFDLFTKTMAGPTIMDKLAEYPQYREYFAEAFCFGIVISNQYYLVDVPDFMKGVATGFKEEGGKA